MPAAAIITMRVFKILRRLSVGCLGLLFMTGAQAAKPQHFVPRVWLTPGMYSFHFNTHKGLRNANPGLGVEYAWAPSDALFAGTYINSNDARSRYVAYAWRPLHAHILGLEVGAGAVAAVIDGYPHYRNGGWYVAPLPILSFEGRRFGLNMSLIPTLPGRVDGALSFQFKLRVN